MTRKNITRKIIYTLIEAAIYAVTALAEASMHKRWRPDEGFDYARSTRHMKKWLEIADIFKEAK